METHECNARVGVRIAFPSTAKPAVSAVLQLAVLAAVEFVAGVRQALEICCALATVIASTVAYSRR
jgi:hypothetical protein